ncbi:heterokaryon incompatibility protein-domain-containing protein [Phaeosphaeriaceae sp. PMI808]|nr:heterokaryon incompatibility protein-domain-containing protein [Phaeosphaeriaceae sp. PMI808]
MALQISGLLEHYVYDKLPALTCIRILVLYPAQNFDDPIELDFLLRNRDDVFRPGADSAYDAVSYVWGEPVFSHRVYNREKNGAQLQVTKSVDRLLRYLRKPAAERRLWVDAVCIDQSSEEDKYCQVQAMGSIFLRARKVRIWMGEPDPALDCARLFDQLRASRTQDLENPAYSRGYSLQLSSLRPGLRESLVRGECHQLLLQLLRNPWFGRRWVVQEAALAQKATVHIGWSKIDWLLLRSVLKTLAKSLPNDCPDTKCALATVTANDSDEVLLLDLLWDLHLTECLEPKDRLFALIGLAQRRGDFNHLHRLQYDRPWKSVYHQFAEMQIQEGRAHTLVRHLAAFGAIQPDTHHSFPSWVPDWSRMRIDIFYHAPDEIKYTEVAQTTQLIRNSLLIKRSARRCGEVLFISDLATAPNNVDSSQIFGRFQHLKHPPNAAVCFTGKDLDAVLYSGLVYAVAYALRQPLNVRFSEDHSRINLRMIIEWFAEVLDEVKFATVDHAYQEESAIILAKNLVDMEIKRYIALKGSRFQLAVSYSKDFGQCCWLTPSDVEVGDRIYTFGRSWFRRPVGSGTDKTLMQGFFFRPSPTQNPLDTGGVLESMRFIACSGLEIRIPNESTDIPCTDLLWITIPSTMASAASEASVISSQLLREFLDDRVDPDEYKIEK